MTIKHIINYNDYIAYLPMFISITKNIKTPDELVWHPSEEINWLAKMMGLYVLVNSERLDKEQCSITQEKNRTIVEFVFVKEIVSETGNYYIWEIFKYSDEIDWFFFYEKEIEKNNKKYILEI